MESRGLGWYLGMRALPCQGRSCTRVTPDIWRPWFMTLKTLLHSSQPVEEVGGAAFRAPRGRLQGDATQTDADAIVEERQRSRQPRAAGTRGRQGLAADLGVAPPAAESRLQPRSARLDLCRNTL